MANTVNNIEQLFVYIHDGILEDNNNIYMTKSDFKGRPLEIKKLIKEYFCRINDDQEENLKTNLIEKINIYKEELNSKLIDSFVSEAKGDDPTYIYPEYKKYKNISDLFFFKKTSHKNNDWVWNYIYERNSTDSANDVISNKNGDGGGFTADYLYYMFNTIPKSIYSDLIPDNDSDNIPVNEKMGKVRKVMTRANEVIEWESNLFWNDKMFTCLNKISQKRYLQRCSELIKIFIDCNIITLNNIILSKIYKLEVIDDIIKNTNPTSLDRDHFITPIKYNTGYSAVDFQGKNIISLFEKSDTEYKKKSAQMKMYNMYKKNKNAVKRTPQEDAELRKILLETFYIKHFNHHRFRVEYGLRRGEPIAINCTVDVDTNFIDYIKENYADYIKILNKKILEFLNNTVSRVRIVQLVKKNDRNILVFDAIEFTDKAYDMSKFTHTAAVDLGQSIQITFSNFKYKKYNDTYIEDVNIFDPQFKELYENPDIDLGLKELYKKTKFYSKKNLDNMEITITKHVHNTEQEGKIQLIFEYSFEGEENKTFIPFDLGLGATAVISYFKNNGMEKFKKEIIDNKTSNCVGQVNDSPANPDIPDLLLLYDCGWSAKWDEVEKKYKYLNEGRRGEDTLPDNCVDDKLSDVVIKYDDDAFDSEVVEEEYIRFENNCFYQSVIFYYFGGRWGRRMLASVVE